MEERRKKESWHLDKKVPLSIILAIFVQTIGLVWWAVQLDSRVNAMENKYAAQDIIIETIKSTQNNISVGLARIEERQIILNEVLREIKSRLDKVK